MDDGGKSCIFAEAPDTMESVSCLSVSGNPSPVESTVLPNTEERQVWVGFVVGLLIMGFLNSN